MEATKQIDHILKSLRDELDEVPLPEQEVQALVLSDSIERLKMAKFLIHLYKDR